ncbi:hypothetical protein FGO68_gene2062 [Halteria grandinella]|uniref:Uncharacterized protein n=1 Tax=Halteria grandinella TaxID=5974 RepID=A0A8J8T758_HALGN|nr:hypothetical protein FGO68_gene2062 [Halteria grandinella]
MWQRSSCSKLQMQRTLKLKILTQTKQEPIIPVMHKVIIKQNLEIKMEYSQGSGMREGNHQIKEYLRNKSYFKMRKLENIQLLLNQANSFSKKFNMMKNLGLRINNKQIFQISLMILKKIRQPLPNCNCQKK